MNDFLTDDINQPQTIRGRAFNPDVIYGKSAYELAVKYGFEGTEEEWVKSVTQGPQGERGSYWFAINEYAPSSEFDVPVSSLNGMFGTELPKANDVVLMNDGAVYLVKSFNQPDETVTLSFVTNITGGNGEDGKDGADGVSVVDAAQTVESTEDGGINTFVIYLDNGQSFSFKFRNGSKGSQGIQGKTGADGKDGLDATPVVPLFANDISECIDTTKPYVLPDGFIYTYRKIDKLVRENQFASGYALNSRVGSNGSISSTGQNGMVVTNQITIPDYVNPYTVTISGVTLVNCASYNYAVFATLYNSSGSRVGGKNLGTPTLNSDGKYVIDIYDSSISNVAYVRFNLSISTSAITDADVANLFIDFEPKKGFTK